MSSLKFDSMDLTSYDEVKDADYIPGDTIDTGCDSLESASILLSSGQRSLQLEDVATAISSLAEACYIFSEELEEGSEQSTEAFHWYGKALLEWARMEGSVFEYAMEGFDLGEAEEPKVEVEEGEVSREEQAEIEDKVAGALEENYDSHDNVAKLHMDVDMESEGESSESEDDSEGSETGEDDSEVEDESVEEELAEPSNLELAWEVLEVARLGYSKAGNKTALAEVYLDLGEVSVENQDYGRAVEDFTACLDIKKSLLPADSRSVAAIHYQLGLAQAYSGKLPEAETNLQSAISILEVRMSNLAKMEQSDSVAMEKIDLETCIQEIKEVIVDQKDMNEQIATGSVGAKLATRMGMKPESMMSAKQSGTATVGSA